MNLKHLRFLHMAMTVKDLIQKLKSLPENSLVLVDVTMLRIFLYLGKST